MNKKLTLNRETLRQLTADETHRIAGGDETQHNCSRPSGSFIICDPILWNYTILVNPVVYNPVNVNVFRVGH